MVRGIAATLRRASPMGTVSNETVLAGSGAGVATQQAPRQVHECPRPWSDGAESGCVAAPSTGLA